MSEMESGGRRLSGAGSMLHPSRVFQSGGEGAEETFRLLVEQVGKLGRQGPVILCEDLQIWQDGRG